MTLEEVLAIEHQINVMELMLNQMPQASENIKDKIERKLQRLQPMFDKYLNNNQKKEKFIIIRTTKREKELLLETIKEIGIRKNKQFSYERGKFTDCHKFFIDCDYVELKEIKELFKLKKKQK